jgi:hypothetical protein
MRQRPRLVGGDLEELAEVTEPLDPRAQLLPKVLGKLLERDPGGTHREDAKWATT